MKKNEKLSPFLAPILCLFSRSAYQSIANDWKGFAGLYALGIVTASWLALAPQMHAASAKWINESTDYVISAIPSLSLKSGQLSCSVGMPVELRDPKTGTVFAIVDTRVEQPLPDFSPPIMPFALVTADRIVYFRSSAETRIIQFPENLEFSMNGDILRKWSSWLSMVFAPILLALAIPLYYLFFLGKTLLWAVLAVVSSAVLRKDWGFGPLYRMCIVASTPSLLLSTAGSMVQTGGWPWAVGFFITAAYVVFASSTLATRSTSSG